MWFVCLFSSFLPFTKISKTNNNIYCITQSKQHNELISYLHCYGFNWQLCCNTKMSSSWSSPHAQFQGPLTLSTFLCASSCYSSFYVHFKLPPSSLESFDVSISEKSNKLIQSEQTFADLAMQIHAWSQMHWLLWKGWNLEWEYSLLGKHIHQSQP